MKLLHYPLQDGPIDGHAIGIDAHTEWVSFIRIIFSLVIQLIGLPFLDSWEVCEPQIPQNFII